MRPQEIELFRPLSIVSRMHEACEGTLEFSKKREKSTIAAKCKKHVINKGLMKRDTAF